MAAAPAVTQDPVGRLIVGAQYVQSQSGYPELQPGHGARVWLGYRLTPWLELDAGHFDAGSWTSRDGRNQMTFQGLEALLSLGLPVGDGASRLWTGLGFYSGDSRARYDTGSISGSIEHSTRGLEYAAGFDWRASRRLTLRIEYRVLDGVAAVFDDENVGAAAGGLIYELGRDRPGARRKKPLRPVSEPLPFEEPAKSPGEPPGGLPPRDALPPRR